ncbi:hypothetical protein GCM10011378_41320 [Hymenobacter glacieicola]|uniref:Uncharacterized protein n=1 Tax=Hymenobacter glacieicola TaxID=1562124 RepID=A0ABQ1X8U7_9BACT|nr:hypothetical protein GCM10011378_41320 [Hymenobacter glacieicola]
MQQAKKMSNTTYLRKFEYAEKKGVSRARISKLLKAGKLITKTLYGVEVIADCPENDTHFDKPAHNRKNKSEKK